MEPRMPENYCILGSHATPGFGVWFGGDLYGCANCYTTRLKNRSDWLAYADFTTRSESHPNLEPKKVPVPPTEH